MKPNSSRASAALAALALLLLALFPLGSLRAEEPPHPPRGEIFFTTKVPGSGGHVICALFQKEGWLDAPVANVKSALQGRQATCVFQNLKPGAYAIVAFHDQNDNGDIDKNFLGIPTESWCASRDAPAIFGPPSFGSAKFQVGSGRLRLGCSM